MGGCVCDLISGWKLSLFAVQEAFSLSGLGEESVPSIVFSSRAPNKSYVNSNIIKMIMTIIMIQC